MTEASKAPKVHDEFIQRYPALGEAWDNIREAESSGPLDERTLRLLKVAIAVGSLKEGAVHSSVRKAMAAGISREELQQVVALVASTVGMPSTVAVYSWVMEEVEGRKKRRD